MLDNLMYYVLWENNHTQHALVVIGVLLLLLSILLLNIFFDVRLPRIRGGEGKIVHPHGS